MKNKTIMIVCALYLSLHSAASADKLEDFKEAVGNTGCDSIPYSDLRSTCRSQQSEVHPWCDEKRGPVSCKFDISTNKLKELQTLERRQLEELKDKRRDVEDKRSRATDDTERAKRSAELEAADRSIEAAKKRLDDATADLVKRKDLVEKTIYTINKCIDYRRAVMNVYAYATDKVRGENDADIKPLAEILRNRYPVAISGHEEAIAGRFNAIETCKKDAP